MICVTPVYYKDKIFLRLMNNSSVNYIEYDRSYNNSRRERTSPYFISHL
jgi:hypothetical protein